MRPKSIKHDWVSNSNNWIDFAIQQKITQHCYSTILQKILRYIYIFHLHTHMATFTWLQRLTVSFTVTIHKYPITADAESIITSPNPCHCSSTSIIRRWTASSNASLNLTHRKCLQNTCRHHPNIWLQFVLNKAFCICHTRTDQKQSQYYTWLFLL